MAFGFGVGDVLALTRLIINTIEDIHDAPEELQELADQVESVEASLESINDLRHDAGAGNMGKIVRLKGRVKEVLSKMHDVVIKYRDSKGGLNYFKQAMYGVWGRRGIGDLMIKLQQRTDDLTTFLLVQTWRSTLEIRPLIDQVLTGIHQEQELTADQKSTDDINAAPRVDSHNGTHTHTTNSDQIDQVQAVLDHVLQIERPRDPTLLPDQEDVTVEQEIEIQLGQAGIGPSFTKALFEVINKKRKQLAHPEDIDPISYTGGKNRLEIPKGWIMVVDSRNEGDTEKPIFFKDSTNITEVQSIIAQTYLELVRVWTVNNSGEWLFNRVESAGVRVESKFSKRSLKSQSKALSKGGSAPNNAALKAISGKESYFRSEEKNDILARIAQHRSRGLDNWHFRKYEYMLCFDKSVYEALTTLAKYCKKRYGNMPSYANLSKIILLKDIKPKTAIDDLDTHDTSELVNNIKNSIKKFLDTEYHWKRPPLSIADGPFRTKQIVLPTTNMKFGPTEKEAILNEISSKTDCRIRITDERFDFQLLSITGRREALPLAVSLLQDCFSRKSGSGIVQVS
ncbi:hypothetical protein P7C71_g2997, partial [Lecanoromycetidae sp. Uapishka_2]